MNRKKFLRRCLTTFLIAIFALSAAVVGAKIQMYTVTGEDFPSVREAQDIPKQRALENAIKKATKQAGEVLLTYSRSVNSELTEDEVTAITSNSWKIVGEPKYSREIINHSDDTQIIVWKVTVDVSVDDSEIQRWIKRDDKDKSTIISQTREAQKSSEENDRKITDLREQYKRATSQAERDRIIKQMEQTDRDFLANQKFKEALKLHYAKDFNGAIKLYDEMLKFGEYSETYNNRGLCYDKLGQKDKAIQDYNKAIQLNPNSAAAYNNRGACYNELGQNERAIQDYNKAIQLAPNSEEAYYNRGLIYSNFLFNHELSVKDFSKVIQINPKNFRAYNNRGLDYIALGKLDLSVKDFTKSIELNPNDALVYQMRGSCYKKLGDKAKAQADFKKAKELGYNG